MIKHVGLAALLLIAGMVWRMPAQAAPETAAAPTAAAAPATAPAVAAGDIVKGFYTALVETMKQGEQLGYAGRYKKLDPAVRADFNLPLMARIAVGPVWSQATPDERQQLVSAFSDFSVASYASQFTKYNGEEFTVIDQKPLDDGVLVETTLKPKDKDPIALNYLLRPDDKGNYRIVDIFLNGSISQLAARRAEFNSIAERQGIAALVTTLGQKSRQMGPS